MYVRMSIKKGRTYYELVETIWKRGMPRTRFVAYLGKELPSDKELLKIYEDKATKLNKAYTQGQKEGVDLRNAYDRMLDRFAVIKSKRPLTQEEKDRLNQANLVSLRRSQQKLLESLGFIKFRKGYLDPSRQVFLSLETGEVLRRKTRRFASVLVGKSVYDTEVFKQQLGFLEPPNPKPQKVENKGSSLSREEFRKFTGS